MSENNGIDLTNLREMTGGDKDIEKELFAVFISSSEECLQALEKSLTVADNEMWRKNAHAMKGTSLNLGANALGELCKKAQDDHATDVNNKKNLLASIKSEYEKVKAFLSTQ